MKRPEGVCKDCWGVYMITLEADPTTKEPRWRPAPHPGPRCVTDHRAWTRRNRRRAHDRNVETNFGIPAELYWALYEFQGGKCAILGCRATGKTRALAVDHDHQCCPGRTSCGKCVRGLLCNPHNEMFGRNGDDPSVFRDMADYLEMSTMTRYLYLHTRTGDWVTEYVQGLVGLEGRTQSEQLDRHTGPGAVEKQGGTVRRYREHTSAVDPVAGQDVAAAGDDEV
jgi:recombination endonuclease VII